MKGFKVGVFLGASVAILFLYGCDDDTHQIALRDVPAIQYSIDPPPSKSAILLNPDLEDTGEQIAPTEVKKEEEVFESELKIEDLTEYLLSEDECYKNPRQFWGCIRAANYLLDQAFPADSPNAWRLIPTKNAFSSKLKIVFLQGELSVVQVPATELQELVGTPLKNEISIQEKSEAQKIYYRTKHLTEVNFSVIFSWIQQNIKALEKNSTSLLMNVIQCYLTTSRDPHSYPLFESTYNKSYVDLPSDRLGLGITYLIRGGRVFVFRVIRDSSAEMAGLKMNDEIVAIDGMKVDKSDGTRISKRLTYTDKPIQIKVKRDDSYLLFELVGKKYIPARVNISFTGTHNQWGYILFNHFEGGTCDEVRDSITELEQLKKAQGSALEGLIIDLRANGGGSLPQVGCLIGKFIGPNLPYVYRLDLDGNTDPIPLLTEDLKSIPYKTIVLVGPHSASASEIFAGAMQYYEKGMVMGNETVGKGSMQAKDLEDSTFTAKKISIVETKEYYLMPDMGSIQNIGIKPDIRLPSTQDLSNIIKEESFLTALPLPAKSFPFEAPAEHKKRATEISACMKERKDTKKNTELNKGPKPFYFEDSAIFEAADALECWQSLTES